MKRTLILVLLYFIVVNNDLYSQKTIDEITKVVSSDIQTGDLFGLGAAIDGNFALIGARQEDGGASNGGAAYFFEFDGTTWNQQGKILASDAQAGDWFGTGVALSGTNAVLGAQFEDAGGNDAGAYYFYQYDGNNWVELNKILPSDIDPADNNGGSAVAMSNNYAIGGTQYEDTGGLSKGSAYFFEFDGSNWSEMQKVQASDGVSGDAFGASVDIDGTIAMMGAINNNGRGAVYFFKFDGSTWNEIQKITPSDGAAGDNFGCSISIDGTNAIIGARTEDDKGTDAGAVYYFKYDGVNWNEVNKVTASDGAANDNFGVAVSISGLNVIIGASADNSNQGSAYLFEIKDGILTEVSKFTASDGSPNSVFGVPISISEKKVLVSAPGDDSNGSDAGASYFFELNLAPSISEFEVTSLNNLLAELSVDVDDSGLATTLVFKYGTSSGNYTFQTDPISLTGDDLKSTETAQLNQLIQNQTYFVIAEATNSDGTTQSNEIQFTALTNINDSDGDGLVDNEEINAPNNGDGNGDGTQDYLQRSVTTIRDALDNSYITIVSQDNFNLNEVGTSLPDDNMFSYPFGKTEFKINASQAEVKIYFHGIASLDGYTYRKLLPNDRYGQFDNVTFSKETIGGNEVAVATLRLVDGGPGDYDGIVNGVIYDPGGPALPVSANIPFWDWWWVLVLVPMMVYGYRRFG